jgi:hypothetical protein
VGEDAIRDTGRDTGRDAGATRVAVAEAAKHLGITKEAVRKRISRGTLRSDKDPDGTVRVYIPASSTERVADTPTSASDPLISEMRDRIASLERQLEQERQANSEHRRLLAAALERIPPQLEAASEAQESPETPSEGGPSTAAPPEPETPAETRPWWRRIFGA